MSFQVSCDAAAAHPFTGELLDLIARYEQLRLSGRVPGCLKARLRIDPELTAIKPGAIQPELLARQQSSAVLAGKPYAPICSAGQRRDRAAPNGAALNAAPHSTENSEEPKGR